jgi:hypothetical protein
MPGSVDLNLDPVPPARPSKVVVVFRYDPEAGEGLRFEPQPHLRLVSVSRHEGPRPWAARFRYALDDEVLAAEFPDMPRRAEHVFGLAAASPWRVEVGERLVAVEYDPEAPGAAPRMVFDGFAEAPQVDLGPDLESVTFEAAATPVRCWDRVIESAPYRDADKWDEELHVRDLSFAGCWRFNPEGEGNGTRPFADEFPGEPHAYPVFIDHRIPRERREVWDLAGAARAIVWFHNFNETYVRNPIYGDFESLLVARVPREGAGPIGEAPPAGEDPEAGPSDTFTVEDIDVPDLDCTGMCWPDALWRLVEPHGFTFRWELALTESGEPDWHLVLDRKDTAAQAKDLKLQAPGSAYDARLTNLGAAAWKRDGEVANEWASLTVPARVEALFVLAPRFVVEAEDADGDNLAKWREGTPDFDPSRYRRWGVDECGLGHPAWESWEDGGSWKAGDGEGDFLREPTPLDRALDVGGGFPPPPYSVRPRPGTRDLLGRPGADGRRRKARLYVSTDYQGDVPGVGDGTGTWQEVTGGGWRLLEDELGVELTDPDLERWSIGDPPDDPPPGGAAWPFPAGVVRAVSATAGADGAGPAFVLGLLTAIDLDVGIGGLGVTVAARRAASPVPFDVRRADETRDRHRLELVHESSPDYGRAEAVPDPGAPGGGGEGGDGGEDEGGGGPAPPAEPFLDRFKLVRDDRARLRAHLAARRRAQELAAVAGPVTVPLITHAYRVGDRVRGVAGRGIGLRQNVPFDEAEAPVYPVVAAVSWTYEPAQSTTLQLADVRGLIGPSPEAAREEGA